VLLLVWLGWLRRLLGASVPEGQRPPRPTPEAWWCGYCRGWHSWDPSDD
jgi:hypothetical protein